MKNFAIGCLAVLVVLAVAGGGIAWFKVIKPGMEFAGGVAELGREYSELNEAIENRSGFAPPADGELGEDRFQRFLAAQRQMRNALEGRLETLEDKYESLEAEIEERGGQAGVGDMMDAYGDLTGLLIDAKRAQVEAINAQDFSLSEYNWVREQVYRAIGESVAVAAISNGAEGGGEFEAQVPEATREMVEPYRDELLQGHALAWWGL
ncbi:MAG: hypothetical protein KGY53_12800 [Wenzhouxiangellaceae bacterium]|jgi:tetrahydromethanopterin S-methyltransferase subunit G|nr:hypothetical protein [Wenzhouxiangellaceae bacterium]MBS3824763.1 hypothetical protein [Wenzhouxiangellaceae bacterium]